MSIANSAFTTLSLESRGHVAYLRLDRPERLNAINRMMLAELPEAFALIAADDDLRVTVMMGAGRSFSAGFDVQRPASAEHSSDYHTRDPLEEREDLRSRMTSLLSPWDHPKPVIAAIHGHCLAAATLLAGFADLTIVARDAKIGLPSLPLGGGFLSPAWVHLVGPKRAKQLSFLAGEQIDGETAALWGWANYAVDAAELLAHVDSLAARMSRTPGEVLRLKKAGVNRIVDAGGWRPLLLAGADTDALAHQSPGVRRMQEHIRTHGLKQAVADFADGRIEL